MSYTQIHTLHKSYLFRSYGFEQKIIKKQTLNYEITVEVRELRSVLNYTYQNDVCIFEILLYDNRIVTCIV